MKPVNKSQTQRVIGKPMKSYDLFAITPFHEKKNLVENLNKEIKFAIAFGSDLKGIKAEIAQEQLLFSVLDGTYNPDET